MIETESTAVIGPPGERRGGPRPEDADAATADAWGVPEFDQETIIRPRPGWIAINWQEMWAQRELLLFLVWRDISVRYKQTVLGPAWAMLQPLMTMLIFSFIFGRFVKIPSEGFPYPVFVFAG